MRVRDIWKKALVFPRPLFPAMRNTGCIDSMGKLPDLSVPRGGLLGSPRVLHQPPDQEKQG